MQTGYTAIYSLFPNVYHLQFKYGNPDILYFLLVEARKNIVWCISKFM
jgi:hypothetical protein